MIVELDPVGQHAAGMLEGFEAMPVNALLFDRANHALDQTILLRTVGCDEFLLEPIPAHQRRIAATRKDEPIV